MSQNLKTNRIRLLSIGVIVVVVILISKLYLVQIINNDDYQSRADRQYLRPQISYLDRGSIVFEDKDGVRIDAATLKTGYTVALNPSVIKEPADVYNNLSFILDVDEETFINRVSKSNDPYEEIVKRVDKESAIVIQDLNIEGVSVVKDRWRFYPGNSLASQVLGFMSFNEDEFKGQYGLERQYDEILTKNNENSFANFFVEIFSNLGEKIKGEESGGNIIATIEPTVQATVEEEIAKVTKDWNSKLTGAIVMNPKNGEIYSMAINPTFDLNNFSEVDDVSIFNNDLVESVYEMGSIVKPLTIAIGLDTGAVTTDTTYYDAGELTLNNYTIYNFDKKGRGTVPLQTILNESLNTGAAYVANKTGGEKFSEYMKKLIGQKTQIDLPNEVSPLVQNLDSQRNIEIATAPYSQGIAMTPISITRALATLGNGGLLVEPHVVKKIEYEVGLDKKIKDDEHERIFSQKTSEEISRMLVNVVDEALLNGEVALPNHSIAAKTGTAQIANKTEGGYYDDRYLHSFFGYFPAYDPEFIIFLYTIEPKGVQYSSQTLTMPFINIAKFLINYYEIPPDR